MGNINTNFYGDEGITMTSANHLCNIAKEYVAQNHSYINNLSFVTESVTVNGFSHPVTTKVGIDDMSNIEGAIDKIGKFNAFIAYMREAIKNKDVLLKNLPTLEAYKQTKYPDVVSPVYPVTVTFDDVFSEKSIKEQTNYFRLEALCAAIGKTIHPSYSFHEAREHYYDSINNPAKVYDNKVITYTPTVTAKDLDDVYFSLQKKHREAEAQLNAIKHSIELVVNERNDDARNKYQTAYNSYNRECRTIENEYEEFMATERQRINNLKIVIPNDLEDTYKFLSNL